MKILEDVQEKKPFDFSNCPYVTQTFKTKLDVGDYMCILEDGFFPKISFERKSINDLYGTMGGGYPRFKRELLRAKELQIRLFLIIEGSMTKVAKGHNRSAMSGETMIKKLMTLWIRYDLYPIFCKDRAEAVQYIYSFFCSIGWNKAKTK